jgi:hypothetical protein
MYFVKPVRTALALTLLATVAACGGMADDLRPSGADQRGGASAVSTASVADIALATTDGDVTIGRLLETNDGVVLYFTMWCPVCDSHMSHMRTAIVPDYPNVAFVLVDYVSGSVATAARAAAAAGYADSVYRVAADLEGGLVDRLGATMGTTVVIDRTGSVVMSEDYKNGVLLRETLGRL